MNAASANRYMLDANAFDYLLDHGIDPRSVRRLGEIFITTVQHGELLDVPDRRRREGLLRILSGVDPTVRPAFAEPRPGRGDPGGDPVRRQASPGAAGAFGGASRKPGRWKDAAIGAAARREGCVLVTDDRELRRGARASGLTAISCAEAFSTLAAPSPPSAR